MASALVLLTDGFEEMEALTPVDLLRRGKVDVTAASITGDLNVTGSHNITVKADELFDGHRNSSRFDMVILPGGPGTQNYKQSPEVLAFVKEQFDQGKLIGAICAAPSVLGYLGILTGKKAVCFPGYEDQLNCKEVLQVPVIRDGNVITSRGAGTAVEFALELLGALMSEEDAQEVARAIQYVVK